MTIKNNILTVCHDAGGAEVVSAYVQAHRREAVFYCIVSGPAEKIFKRKKINNLFIFPQPGQTLAGIIEQIQPINLVLTGTSWGSSIEIDCIREAKARGLKTVAFIDHWVNYRERFGYPHRGWKDNLPDAIWVGDRPAYEVAKKKFTGQRIRLVPNPFFKEITASYRAAVRHLATPAQAILFASEPLQAATNRFKGKKIDTRIKKEAYILQAIFKCLVAINYRGEVIIRYHPSELPEKYDTLIQKFNKKLIITRSMGQGMFEDLAKANFVIGMQSMFLVVATLCQKKVISFLPGNNERCRLPVSAIIKVKTARKLAQVLSKKSF